MSNSPQRLIGGVEAGGTTFRCAVAQSPQDILAETTIATRGPEETLEDVISFFAKHPSVQALGIASFGPLNLDLSDPGYGALADTPKLDWQGYPLLRRLRERLNVPAHLDTDVVAAGMAEYQLGCARGAASLVYITVGTGIGGAYLINGQPNPGLKHAEMGHIPVARAPDDDFPGCCPFHGDCLEGMASASAIFQRWQCPPEQLPKTHPAWRLEAYYLAGLCLVLMRTLAPHAIVLGGGRASGAWPHRAGSGRGLSWIGGISRPKPRGPQKGYSQARACAGQRPIWQPAARARSRARDSKASQNGA